VFVGLALDDSVESREMHLPGDRQRVREFTVITALDLLRHRLLERDPS
jgi:nicotinamide-nucleotide amidase